MRRLKKLSYRYIRATKDETLTYFEGDFDIKAGADDKALPTIDILANTGKPMRVEGHSQPVIIDMKGAYFQKKKTPIILNHDDTTRVGHTVTQTVDVDASQIRVSGLQSATTKEAKEFAADAKNGFPFQSSVGAKIEKSTIVPAGKTVMVNGKSWEGPLKVANKTSIREISVLVFGADSDTIVDVAASKSGDDSMWKTFEEYLEANGMDESTMSEEQKSKMNACYLKAKKLAEKANPAPKPKKPKKPTKVKAGAVDDDDEGDDDDDDVEGSATNGDDDLKASRELRARESRRVDQIESLAAKYGQYFKTKKDKVEHEDEEYTLSDFKAHAIEEGMNPDKFELVLMRHSRTKIPTAPAGFTIDQDVDGQVMEAALLRQFGMEESGQAKDEYGRACGRPYGLKHYYNEKVLNAMDGKQYKMSGSIQNLLAWQIKQAGHYFPSVDRTGSDFLAAAVAAHEELRASGFSTLLITNILENVMHKQSLAAFDSVPGVWREITARKSANDFKPLALYRLDWQGHFRKVPIDGELKHITMADTKKTLQLDTYGAMIAVDRKTIRNDDLNLVLEKCRSLGLLGAARIEESVMVLLLANTGSFFAAGNGNLISGGGSVLGLAGLEAARQKFFDQVINGKPIGIAASKLLVGSNQLTLANQLYTQESLAFAPTTAGFGNNQFVRNYKPFVSPYLNNTNITDQDGKALTGQSATQWYLFCDPNAPQGAALAIAFLDGRDQPFFDSAETAFNVPGGLQFRSYLDWGVNFFIPQMAVKSAGA